MPDTLTAASYDPNERMSAKSSQLKLLNISQCCSDLLRPLTERAHWFSNLHS